MFYLQSYYHILFSTCETFLNMSWVYYVVTNNTYKLLTIFQCVDVYLNEPIKVDELIKLSNHSIQRHTFHRINKDNNNSCFWKQKISWLLAEVKTHLIKKNINSEKDIAPMDLTEDLTKTGVSEKYRNRTEKFITANFYEKYLGVELEGGIGWSKLLLESALQCL